MVHIFDLRRQALEVEVAKAEIHCVDFGEEAESGSVWIGDVEEGDALGRKIMEVASFLN